MKISSAGLNIFFLLKTNPNQIVTPYLQEHYLEFQRHHIRINNNDSKQIPTPHKIPPHETFHSVKKNILTININLLKNYINIVECKTTYT